MNDFDIKSLIASLESDPITVAAYLENGFRRELAKVIMDRANEMKVDLYDIAKELKISRAELRRLMHMDMDPKVSLASIYRIMCRLGLNISWTIHVREQP